MRQFDVVIRGNIVLEDKVIAGEIGILAGKIEEITAEKNKLVGEKIQDYGSSFVFPGMIDVHVHCYSNIYEGFTRTSKAAAVGGVTTFMDMPYDLPKPINNVAIFKEKVERLKKEAVVDIGLWGTISKTDGTNQIEPLAKAGAMAFKMSTFETDAHRFPRIPDAEIIKAMNLIKESGVRAAFHSENDDLIYPLIDQYETEKKVYPKAHMETRPPVSESSAVLKLLEFAYWTNVKLHIVHVSHPHTVHLIQLYKDMGVEVTAETCYPYLLLNADALDEFGPIAKNNPPLRLPEDQAGLWEQVENHQLEIISSDHAPWDKESKEIGNDNIFLAKSGMPGVEVMVPLMFDAMVSKGKMGPVELAKYMAIQPAEVFGIPNKGKIEVGYDADFTVIDPTQTFLINQENMQSNCKLSPFHNQTVQGKVVGTIVRGVTVYDGEKITVDPGFGEFVPGAALQQEATTSVHN